MYFGGIAAASIVVLGLLLQQPASAGGWPGPVSWQERDDLTYDNVSGQCFGQSRGFLWLNVGYLDWEGGLWSRAETLAESQALNPDCDIDAVAAATVLWQDGNLKVSDSDACTNCQKAWGQIFLYPSAALEGDVVWKATGGFSFEENAYNWSDGAWAQCELEYADPGVDVTCTHEH